MEKKRVEPDEELDRLAHEVIDAGIEVHRALGPGYSEAIYEEALCVELGLRRIPFARQEKVDLHYKGERLGEWRLDLLIAGRLVAELKAVEALSKDAPCAGDLLSESHRTQTGPAHQF